MVDYVYDAENRWIGENIDSSGDGVIDHETRFVYDGDQIVLQFDKSPLPAGEGQGEGGENQGSAMTVADLSHRYLWQANAVDQLMADEQLSPRPVGEGQGEGGYDLSMPGTVVLPLADQQGTIKDLAVTDPSTGVTSIVTHRVYDGHKH